MKKVLTIKTIFFNMILMNSTIFADEKMDLQDLQERLSLLEKKVAQIDSEEFIEKYRKQIYANYHKAHEDARDEAREDGKLKFRFPESVSEQEKTMSLCERFQGRFSNGINPEVCTILEHLSNQSEDKNNIQSLNKILLSSYNKFDKKDLVIEFARELQVPYMEFDTTRLKKGTISSAEAFEKIAQKNDEIDARKIIYIDDVDLISEPEVFSFVAELKKFENVNTIIILGCHDISEVHKNIKSQFPNLTD